MRKFNSTATLATAVLMALLVQAGPLRANNNEAPDVTPSSSPIKALEGVSFDQNLNAQIDLNLEFTDSTGEKVRLSRYFKDKPVIIALAYYECPMLCTLELNGLVKALRAIPKFNPGRDFEIVTLSFDPGETAELAAAKKEQYLDSYRREGAANAWHFLVGEQSQIRKLADTLGFHYRYDEKTDLYRHASGIVVLTPDGHVSRYQFGVEYSARDLEFSLIEAADYGIGSVVDAVQLYCFHYDPETGKYGFVIMNALRLGGAVTVLLLAGFILISLLRDRKARMRAA